MAEAMDMGDGRAKRIVDGLNDPQAEAVSAPIGNHLVIAGAGSGKTRVLTHRIAWLIEAEGVRPRKILAVTFTNKAAAEMRERIENLLDGSDMRGITVGTFHAICHRMLRINHKAARLTKNFTIMDSDDQKRAIKNVLDALNLDPKAWTPRECANFINACKDEGVRSNRYEPREGDIRDATFGRIYAAYEGACRKSHLVDFGELLLRSYEVLRDNDEIRAKYQSRFSQLLVDEFQDTNTIQYRWLGLIAGKRGNIMAVGDDDQSIYGWRGARIENLRKLTDDFDDVATVRLEQNYRSSGNILDAANVLIANNKGRLGKKLWSADEAGKAIRVFEAFDGRDEASFIADTVEKRIDDGARADTFAVLYRTNAQSRQIEQAFIANSVPYRVYGGVRFFERAEVKNALAYMRLILDPNTDGAFERVVNTPARRIGHATVDAIRAHATKTGLSLWQAANDAAEGKLDLGRSSGAVRGFVELIGGLRAKAAGESLAAIATIAVRNSGCSTFTARSATGRGKCAPRTSKNWSTQPDSSRSRRAAFCSKTKIRTMKTTFSTCFSPRRYLTPVTMGMIAAPPST